jgi:hypothetical protein
MNKSFFGMNTNVCDGSQGAVSGCVSTNAFRALFVRADGSRYFE